MTNIIKFIFFTVLACLLAYAFMIFFGLIDAPKTIFGFKYTTTKKEGMKNRYNKSFFFS